MPYPIKPQIRLLILPLVLLVSNLVAQTTKPSAKPSKEVVQYLDKFQQIIRKHSLYTDSIDWKQLEKEVQEKSVGLATVEECKPVVDHVILTLRRAGDKHSFFMQKAKAASWASSYYEGKQAESRHLGNGIGYIKIPAFSSSNPSVGLAFSHNVQSQLEALENQHPITSWVVDLRHNTGGNMHPMISGLQALIGQGIYGYFIFPRHNKERPLQSRRNSNKQQSTTVITTTPKRLAVLTDSLTGSSGEMVAIALKGLSNTRFFGQPTAGYTTINQDFTLSDGARLFLATGYMADKNRKAYLHHITPDVVVEYSPATAQDETIEAARRWLLETK